MSSGDVLWNTLVKYRSLTTCPKWLLCFTKTKPKIQHQSKGKRKCFFFLSVHTKSKENIIHSYRFHVELHFSPGVNCCVQKNLPPGPGFRTHHRNESVSSKIIFYDATHHFNSKPVVFFCAQPTEISPSKSCPTSIPPGSSNSVCSPNCTRIEEEDLDITDVVDHSEQPKNSFLSLSVPMRASRTSSGSESPSVTPPNTLKIPITTSEPIPIR